MAETGMAALVKKAISFSFDQLSEVQEFLSKKSSFCRISHIFWLLGPLILLIERSPADAWLTICSILFLAHVLIERDVKWLKVPWVWLTFLFWASCLLSALLSDLPFYSLAEAFIWVRFPLFAMACCFWFGKHRAVFCLMLYSTFLGMIVMCLILLAEISVLGLGNGRLTWPYGDAVPGNYLAKVSMPVFCIMVAAIMSKDVRISILALFLSLFTMTLSFATGERVNFILRICSAFVSLLAWQFNLKRTVIFAAIILSSLWLLFSVTPQTYIHDPFRFYSELPIFEDSPYRRVWNGAFYAFQMEPFFGIGPDNYRMLCGSFPLELKSIDCHTHPHNFYIQIVAETGVVGLSLACLMFSAMIHYSIQTRKMLKNDIIAATSFIVPFGFFFPFQTTADFFGQWNNVFMWCSLGVALASRNISETKSAKQSCR